MNNEVDILSFNECYGEHFHGYAQIMVPLSKSMVILIEDEGYEVSSQELCYVPANMSHRCDYTGKLLALNITNEETSRDGAMLMTPFVISMKGQILQLVDLIKAELSEDPNSKSVHYLYSYLYSKIIENCAPPSVRYINEHYDMPITMEELADMESYNVTYFNEWFKHQTGMSPGIYLRKTRIDKAMDMLENTKFGVTDVAVMVGYSSNSTFTRAFRGVTGMTPKEYREHHKK